MNGPYLLRPLALVGMPGSGKTSVGRLLARRLALPFVDSDAAIEGETGEAITHLFAARGEAHFRRLERQTIDRLLGGAPLILATGGGAMIDADMRPMLLTRATTLWLDAPPDILAARLAGQTHRPLLAGPDLPARLGALAVHREPHYRLAHHRIAADADLDEVVTRILALIRP